jgi:hypothetical protein
LKLTSLNISTHKELIDLQILTNWELLLSSLSNGYVTKKTTLFVGGVL